MPLFWYSTNYNTIENLGLAMPLRRAGCPCFQHGGLAQLARALDLHSRGHRFDSDILHKQVEFFNLLKFFDILRIQELTIIEK